jgi:hypothetical protein
MSPYLNVQDKWRAVSDDEKWQGLNDRLCKFVDDGTLTLDEAYYLTKRFTERQVRQWAAMNTDLALYRNKYGSAMS